ncbi:MAG: AAA family ATPase [Lachnospiraceae bacterium]|nr:AAA family ATPase [Lachnospiraceae bacterium]
MFVKGNVKIGFDKTLDSFYLDSSISNYVNKLNQKFNNKKYNMQVVFFIKNDGNLKNYGKDESFDEIINSILGEEDNKQSKTSDKFASTFQIDYCAKTSDAKIKENDIRDIINKFISEADIYINDSKNFKIIENNIKPEKAIDMFDNLAYNNPSALNNFYKDLLNEKDISVLSETFATLPIKKKEISEFKYNKDVVLSKNKQVCKNDKIKQEIDRIFTIKDNKNIQGLHYLFNENDFGMRTDMYKVLATALYSMGRLSNPYYYIVEIDINDHNFKSNMLYLKTRLKISRNDLYFFEFMKKTEHSNNNNIFEPDGDAFNNGNISFFNIVRENQFINTFGFYADEEAKRICSGLEEKELVEKLSFVVFSNKLNKEAQIVYAKEKLKKFNQMDMIKPMIDVIEYQNTQVDGLSTSELDDFIISVLKSKYEKVYRPAYKNITKDMTNGNITKKLMNMVGLSNLKKAVSEMCNKINFKNIKEDLLPVTKVLNQMANYERNNWILTGVPGTGKSTAAEILEKVMYQEKIIKKDKIVKYTPSKMSEDIVMTPFGPMNISTSNDLHESFIDSVGGVLIIDEIGHLSKDDKSLLLQLMEDYKRDVCVILCGYENEAKILLNYNPGFRSRFTHIVKMDEYTVQELLEILLLKLKEKHFSVSDEGKVKLTEVITTVREVPNFGQARFMESMSDKLIGIHSSNKLKQIEEVMSKNSDVNFLEEDVYKITKEDVENLPLDDMLGEEYKLAKNHKDAYSELHNLIGCSSVKTAVEEFVAKSKVDKIKMDRNLIDGTSFNMNMMFYGSPGTAKTTVARLVARIMYDKGMINKPKITEVGAADLVAAYVGQTAIKTSMVFEEAKGGVLFIDEAYSLANKEAGGYNQEAVDTIIKEMENNRNNTLVIFAGYKDKMEEFIKCNPGFKSRISKYVDFPNYSIEELIQIFNKLCKDRGYTLKENDKVKIEERISKYLEEIKNDKQFGNGRECRTILENAINMQSKRLINIDDPSNEELMTLSYEDFDYLDKENNFDKNRITKIGFAV